MAIRLLSTALIGPIIVSVIIFAVGIYTFFVVASEIEKTLDQNEVQNIGNFDEDYAPIIDLLPFVLIIFAIMAVVGVVMQFARSSYTPTKQISQPEIEKTVEKEKPKYPDVPKMRGDYKLYKVTDVDDALETAQKLRNSKYWSKVTKYTDKKYHLPADNNCAVYVSMWTKDESMDNGNPRWK